MGLYKGQILALQKICVHTEQQIRFDILHAKVTSWQIDGIGVFWNQIIIGLFFPNIHLEYILFTFKSGFLN